MHAIGKGILLAEIQQNSNTTYRVYDYGRFGKDGKQRQLHVSKAIDVTKCEKPKYSNKAQGEIIENDGYSSQLLVKCNLFEVINLVVKSSCDIFVNDDSFVSLLVTEGSGTVNDMPVKKGDSVFISADSGNVNISGELTVIKTNI